jgi:dCMP deaminase
MKPRFHQLYMNIAQEVANMSHARRLKVGAIVVKDDRIISMGYNGMPSGWHNDCEIETRYEDGGVTLTTRPEVLHAEMNALMKLAKSTESGLGAVLFVTHSPCMECSKGIYQAGIARVFYAQDYRDDTGIKFLRASNIDVMRFNA